MTTLSLNQLGEVSSHAVERYMERRDDSLDFDATRRKLSNALNTPQVANLIDLRHRVAGVDSYGAVAININDMAFIFSVEGVLKTVFPMSASQKARYNNNMPV
ncbi:hypothetical protein KMW28_27275 [Flammeovirga yaeyamensis]|uniref:Uncharacterized protein n=1 Tax=Flammeovirga yaeyamensis TaxID=367791 RepID=A0AAX1NAM4_9BACT|nr:hypothetical protein [Flammeovirga yaeyamensis]MBB3700016.1 hypothetical protein [Flammeovirga yaeyamensis]NMF37546.1 hypothetical protein [Flammeovirga yaeyamensis]QWG04603.1 hypothetical protein KMW28_27275 [Flammeovirga yaeyamensis]